MSNVVTLITTLVAVLGMLGGGFGWLNARFEKRFSDCEAREKVLRFEVMRDGKAIRILFEEIWRTNPTSPALSEAGRILQQVYTPSRETSDELMDLLARVDTADERWKARSR